MGFEAKINKQREFLEGGHSQLEGKKQDASDDVFTSPPPETLNEEKMEEMYLRVERLCKDPLLHKALAGYHDTFFSPKEKVSIKLVKKAISGRGKKKEELKISTSIHKSKRFVRASLQGGSFFEIQIGGDVNNGTVSIYLDFPDNSLDFHMDPAFKIFVMDVSELVDFIAYLIARDRRTSRHKVQEDFEHFRSLQVGEE